MITQLLLVIIIIIDNNYVIIRNNFVIICDNFVIINNNKQGYDVNTNSGRNSSHLLFISLNSSSKFSSSKQTNFTSIKDFSEVIKSLTVFTAIFAASGFGNL